MSCLLHKYEKENIKGLLKFFDLEPFKGFDMGWGGVVFVFVDCEMHTLVQLFSQYEQLAVLRLCSKVYICSKNS